VQGYTGAGSSIPVPSLLDQLNTFLTHTPPSHKEAQKILWVVYAGGNNAFFSSPDSDIVEETVDDLQTAIRRIKSIGSTTSLLSPFSTILTQFYAGGTHFLLATLPPLGTRTPYSELADAPTAEHLARFSHEYRTRIYDVARHDPTITVVDFYVLFKRFRITPELYGFDPDKIADSCLTGGEGYPSARATQVLMVCIVYHEVPGGVTACSNPQKYIWWDEVRPISHSFFVPKRVLTLCTQFHPTARAHSLMGYDAHIAVVNKGWAQ
jgi:phospholipase/lecithinase/hemolysin